MQKTTYTIGFHNQAIASNVGVVPFRPANFDTQFTYTFENFFHPFVGELIGQLNRKSVADMLDPTFLQGLADDSSAQNFFTTYYTTNPGQVDVVKFNDFPHKEIDVRGGPYANYNWELLYHIPVAIAVHLSKNQRFTEAQKWFHYVFDPTSQDTTVPTPQRYWKFLGFRQQTDVENIDDLLVLLSTPDSELTPDKIKEKKAVLAGYEAIKAQPFQPHLVASTRTVAYQYYVVMKYLDNLIAWGDNLFLQDTIETINEATLCYVLAANLLGPRPQQLPPRGTVTPKNFAQLKKAGLDPMGNALVELEGQFPFNLPLPATQNSRTSDQNGPLFGIGRTLYFCIPHNDKLLTYWDTVADRLFKIRHCMNIEGIVRQLALFDPPLDPGMLVKAAATGIDIGSIVSGLNQPISPVRCLLLIQKALELAGEVRSLGNALLLALEKGDGEHLALLRQGHEIKIQQMSQEVRFLQWKQAQEATNVLLRSRASVLERYHYYQQLLGLTPDSNVVPDTFLIDRRELTEENFDETYTALIGTYDKTITIQAYPQLTLAGDASPANQSGASGNGKLYLTTNEDVELNTHLPTARDTRLAASIGDALAAVLTFVPDFDVNLHWWGLGAKSRIFGGAKLHHASKGAADVLRMISSWEQDQASMASRSASYERRADDWILQSNLAARELMQIGRQIISSLIAEQVAHHEYLNIQTQIAQAQEVDQFLHDKFTNEELYLWMQGEISRLYYEYYRFAFDIARKAERTMKQELMRPELDAQDFVKFNYWDGGRKGLLSGEALYLDVKRMEMAYHDQNRREYELTKHVSLLQLAPLALLQLRVTGSCTVSLPEELFDMDGPGHYFRRIKSVSVSIPCVTGPYTSVNCTLTLLNSSIRTSPQLSDGSFPRSGSDDPRFSDYYGSIQAIVTSSGQADSGLFETNLHDERFLPFELSGAISQWRLDLPSDVRQFDYDTIADVILHVRYTAREGGDLLKGDAVKNLQTLINNAQTVGSVRLFSVRHEFPTEWAKFRNVTINSTTPTAALSLTLLPQHYPFWAQGIVGSGPFKPITVKSIGLFAEMLPTDTNTATTVKLYDKADMTGNNDTLNQNPSLGKLLSGKLINLALPEAITDATHPPLTLYCDDNSMKDLWLAITWGKG